MADFDYGLRDGGATPDSVEIDGRWYVFELDEERSTIVMRRDGLLLIEIPLDPVIQRAREYQISQVGTRHIPPDILHVAVENERVHISVYLRSVRGSIANPADGGPAGEEPSAGQFRITSFSADYYWSETVEIP